jgi:hypothetical protein
MVVETPERDVDMQDRFTAHIEEIAATTFRCPGDCHTSH